LDLNADRVMEGGRERNGEEGNDRYCNEQIVLCIFQTEITDFYFIFFFKILIVFVKLMFWN